MSSTITICGVFVLALFLSGYLIQWYGLPPPPPKIAGIDLGTTFSSIGIYQAVTGNTDILSDKFGKKSIPSVVSFLTNGTILVGTDAVEVQELNSRNTIYDAKRFIGKIFQKDDFIFQSDIKRYPFTIKLDNKGFVYFEVKQNDKIKIVTPEQIGSFIINYLLKIVVNKYNTKLNEVVISVPAEFDYLQRNYTEKAVKLAGLKVRRIITEPTAAALAYGLHKKKGVEYITVVDFGGGTLDISVLWINGGVFITQALAGNNRLGGQDFNNNILQMFKKNISQTTKSTFDNSEDLQQLRLAIEKAKIQLSKLPETWIRLKFRSSKLKFEYLLTRNEFEEKNKEIFVSFLQPIEIALIECNIKPKDVDEIVLVGGSTRIQKIRNVVSNYFGKIPNFSIDPELAVVTGVTIQAGVLAGGWPLQVTAIEMPSKKRKIHSFNKIKDEI